MPNEMRVLQLEMPSFKQKSCLGMGQQLTLMAFLPLCLETFQIGILKFSDQMPMISSIRGDALLIPRAG